MAKKEPKSKAKGKKTARASLSNEQKLVAIVDSEGIDTALQCCDLLGLTRSKAWKLIGKHLGL